jgi:hypothetical protein
MNWLLTAEPSRLARPIVVVGCAQPSLDCPRVDVTLVDGDPAWDAIGADEALVDTGPVEVCASYRVPGFDESPIRPVGVASDHSNPAARGHAGDEALGDTHAVEVCPPDRHRLAAFCVVHPVDVLPGHGDAARVGGLEGRGARDGQVGNELVIDARAVHVRPHDRRRARRRPPAAPGDDLAGPTRPVDVASGDRDTAAVMSRRRNELCVDAAPVSIRPADRPALIRTTDLPAERLPPVDVLASSATPHGPRPVPETKLWSTPVPSSRARPIVVLLVAQ